MKKVLHFFFTSLERCDSSFLFSFLIVGVQNVNRNGCFYVEIGQKDIFFVAFYLTEIN